MIVFVIRRRRRGGSSNSAPSTPTVSAGTPTSSGVTLTGSAFSDPDVGDTHAASQWQVTTNADANYLTPVISTGDDATNKTSYAASGLTASTAYRARARYKDSAGNYSAWSSDAAFTTAAPANYAIQLAATTGQARTASSVAVLESATTLCLRARVKGSTLIPGISTARALLDLSDGSGAGSGVGLKALWRLSEDASGVVTPTLWVGGLGNATFATNYNVSAIDDPTALYQLLWTWNPASATQKRQFFLWKEGVTAPIVTHTGTVATTTNFSTTAGQAIIAIGKVLSGGWGASNQTDWDFVALYAGSAYDGYNSAVGAPATPTGTDSGILACYLFPEGSGTTSASAVSGGPSLSLTNATWEAGL